MKLSVIPAAFDCLRKGEALANPGVWKVGGEALKAAIAAFVLSLNPIGRAFGHDPQITPEVAGAVALVLVYLAGLFFTAATSKTVGLFPAKPAGVAGPAGNAAAGGDAPAAETVGGISADTVKAAEVWARDQTAREGSGELRERP